MLGSIIKKMREQRNISQEYMAVQLNITQATYSRLESDKSRLSLEKLQEICRLLEIKESDLFNEKQRSSANKAGNASEDPASKVEEVVFLKKMIEMYETENIYLRLSNERLLTIIENSGNRSGSLNT